ncbi:fungal-specific transcription factor domain-containing protein [Lasiosphaeris hirsuta]|uniref:Fungal-specific transcription factor domain-containing protein n=1 Tax=Lasiosphaeris hirsuta TaxID=260670 RepID=A0AA40DNR8_9PEZI|nr:fungal-specific transcription factor domain-containing protein [Lasiosphaeris hirsuta]
MADSSTMLVPRLSKTCNQCRGRKVRCIVPSGGISCQSCSKRQVQCQFIHTKRLVRRFDSPASSVQAPSSSPPSLALEGELYIDRLLEDPAKMGGVGNVPEECIFKIYNRRLATFNLAFFSESRMRILSQRLGHGKLRELIERISSSTAPNGKPNTAEPPLPPISVREASQLPCRTDEAVSASYVREYFAHVHPLFPFLDRSDFERRALAPGLSDTLASDPAFSALYHTVLALGCHYAVDRCFDPAKSEAWGLFRHTLALLPSILLVGETLVNLQAVTAMAIFALNVACIQLGETLTLEAARMAKGLGYHRVTAGSQPANAEFDQTCYRTLWVIYLLERQVCFLIGRGPTLADYDIGCPIPATPESHFDGFNFFLASLRLSRLCSKAFETIFSASARIKTTGEYMAAIGVVQDGLDRWRESIPQRLRPGPGVSLPVGSPDATILLLRLHYTYHSLVLSLCRMDIHVGTGTAGAAARMDASKKRLMLGARAVIQLTTRIVIRPYTPMWILGTVPLSAMLVLFDLVVHNPNHPETETNLALLDVVTGYFSRLEYVTEGVVPVSMLSGFAHIALQYVRESREAGTSTLGAALDAGTGDQGVQVVQLASPSSKASTQKETSTPPGSSGSNGLNQLSMFWPPGDEPSYESLSYPISIFGGMGSMEAMVADDFLDGFDFASMFDTTLPDFSAMNS